MKFIIDILDYLTTKNPKNELPIGACLIHKQKKNYKWNSGLQHAETQFDKTKIQGSDLIVTLEPCAKCLIFLCENKIANIFFGAKNNIYKINSLDFLNSLNIYKPKIFHIPHLNSVNRIQDFFIDKRNMD